MKEAKEPSPRRDVVAEGKTEKTEEKTGAGAASAEPLWTSITNPRTALEKAKEILRLAHNARVEAEKELAAAKLARQEAEISKNTAKQILKLARQSLHEINPAKPK